MAAPTTASFLPWSTIAAMRIPRLFVNTALAPHQNVVLDPGAFHHAVRVLRLKEGSPVILFNGEGGDFPARLTQVDKRHAEAALTTPCYPTTESPLQITLVQGISRGERMDYSLQKAVELGVDRIVPIWTQYGVVRLPAERLTKKNQHWQSIVVGACEQCGRHRLPTLEKPQELAHWLPQAAAGDLLLVLDPEAPHGPRQLAVTQCISLVIGPEGGLSPAEIDHCVAAGFHRLRLGPRVLRTETATVAALAALQTLWGDLG